MNALHHNPDTPPIGRQPVHIQIAPSKPYPWLGSIRGAVRNEADTAYVGGDRFTLEQQRELMKRGGDVPTAPALLVKRQASATELYFPAGQLPPVYAFECPIVGKRGEKIQVIAPNGDLKLVAADGWAHRPYRNPMRDYFNRSYR